MTIPTAPEYIRDGSFYKSPRYQWVRPIIDLVLNDQFEESAVSNFVESLYEGLGAQVSTSAEESEQHAEEPPAILAIQSISSIDSVKNIGLVDLSTPMKLNPGLNIFYGKNASGKSSLYISLCNLLGTPKQVCSNLNITDTSIHAKITVEKRDSGSLNLEWNGEEVTSFQGARVFDSDICTFLVEQDQINKFEIAHLNSEYFPLVTNALSDIKAALEKCESYLQKEYEAINEALLKLIPEFNEIEETLTLEYLEKHKLEEEQQQTLTTLEATITLLLKDDPNSITKNLGAALRAGHSILDTFGKREIEKDADGVDIPTWKFTISDLLQEVGTTLKDYRSYKSLTGKEGQAKLGSILATEWLQGEKWQQFVEASLSFIKSLPEEEATEYSTSKCPYCLQELSTETAKSLIAAYHELHSENKKLQLDCEEKLKDLVKEITALLEIVERIPNKLEILHGELPTVGIETKLSVDLDALKEVLFNSHTALKEKETFSYDENAIAGFKTFGEEIAELCKLFIKTIKNLIRGKQDRETQLEGLRKAANPLKVLKALTKNREVLEKYLTTKSKITNIREKLAGLTALKQALSTCSTRFSKEVPLTLFKVFLDDEYDALSYTPPDIFAIRCATSGTKNKRVYSLRDKKISEIFSEGERKIHALADFLAESKLNSFKGIYIFDDPVNSLDEDRTERVSARLHQLVEDGNQVIVFTHNLVFLNSLVDPTVEKVTEVKRLDNQVVFTPEVKLGTESELKKRLQAINKRMTTLSKESELQQDEYFLRNIYDLISGYLESYVEIKLFKNVINRYRPNIRMHSLDKLCDFDAETVMPILELYQQTSRKGSRHSQPTGTPTPTYAELQDHYAQFRESFAL